MKSKKAFEIQFNWIFVLVAGAAIILIFSVIISKQKALSDSSSKAEVLRSFESIIAGAQSSLGTTNTIDLLESDIKIGCGTISIGPVSRQYSNLVIFSPDRLYGTRFVVQTYQLSMPYRTSNLLSVTSGEINYALIGSDSLAKKINSSIPKELRKQVKDMYPASGIASSNSYKTRIIIVNPNPALSSSPAIPYALKSGEEASILEVKGDENKGILVYYSKKTPAGTWTKQLETEYLGFGMLMSAVYSDSEIYECSVSNALKRASIVAEVHIKRAQELLVQNPSCSQIYSDAITQLTAIKAAMDAKNMDVSSNAAELKNINSRATRESCPLVY